MILMPQFCTSNTQGSTKTISLATEMSQLQRWVAFAHDGWYRMFFCIGILHFHETFDSEIFFEIPEHHLVEFYAVLGKWDTSSSHSADWRYKVEPKQFRQNVCRHGRALGSLNSSRQSEHCSKPAEVAMFQSRLQIDQIYTCVNVSLQITTKLICYPVQTSNSGRFKTSVETVADLEGSPLT